MSGENGEGFNPERKIVDYVKDVVKRTKVLDLPEGKERSMAANEVLTSMKIAGVGNLKDLLDKRNDKNINQDALGRQVDYLGTAIGEVMMESENEEMKKAVTAGSFSTEKFLPKSWIFEGDAYSGDTTLARVIVDGVNAKIFDKEKRASVTRVMETVDFYKNNPQYIVLLGPQIDMAIGELNKIINTQNRTEAKIISDRLMYLYKLKTEKNSENNNSSGKVDSGIGKEIKSYSHKIDIEKMLRDEGFPEVVKYARHMLEIIETSSQLSTQQFIGGEAPMQHLQDIAQQLGSGEMSGLIYQVKANGNEEEARRLDLMRKEIKARLAISDTGKLMVQSGFKLGDPERGSGMAGVYIRAREMDRTIDREVLTFLFRESGEMGLKIAKAWNMIQDANFQYGNVLGLIWEELGAEKIGIDKKDFFDLKGLSNVDGQDGGFFMDRNDGSARSKIVEKFILERLGKDGQTSLRLTYSLIDAVAERSLFNFRLKGSDQLGPLIYSSDEREEDSKDGKDVGPLITMCVKSFANGCMRYLAMEKKKNYLGYGLSPLYAEDIQVDKATKESKKEPFTYFTKVITQYSGEVSAAFKDSQPDLKTILTGKYLKRLSSNIDALDPSGELKLKQYYVLGLMQIIATDTNIGVTRSTIRLMERLFVGTMMSDTYSSFINNEQWKWCLSQEIGIVPRFGRRGQKKIDFYAAIRRKESMANRDEKLDALLKGQSFLSGDSKKK